MKPLMRSTKPIKLCWLALTPTARAAGEHIVTPKNLILLLPLPGQAAPGAALLPHTVSSGLVKHLPAEHHFPAIQLCFIPCSIVICQLKRLKHVC